MQVREKIDSAGGKGTVPEERPEGFAILPENEARVELSADIPSRA